MPRLGRAGIVHIRKVEYPAIGNDIASEGLGYLSSFGALMLHYDDLGLQAACSAANRFKASLQ